MNDPPTPRGVRARDEYDPPIVRVPRRIRRRPRRDGGSDIILPAVLAGRHDAANNMNQVLSPFANNNNPLDNKPDHVKDLYWMTKRTGMRTLSQENGLEKQVVSLYPASPIFDPKDLFITRVTACVGWAIHGLIFEYACGKRQGSLLKDYGDRKSMALTDKNIENRAGVGWTDIEYGDYIVGMHGYHLNNPALTWFCHSLTLEFASGMTVQYESNHAPWRGEAFSYVVPQPCLVYRIAFKNDQKADMLGLVTSIHLPLSRTNVTHLPPRYREAVNELLFIAQCMDESRASEGRKPLGEDVWWTILGFMRGWELGIPPPAAAQGGNVNSPTIFSPIPKPATLLSVHHYHFPLSPVRNNASTFMAFTP